MRNVVGIYMSTSSYAIDSAWFLLKQEDDRRDYDISSLMSEKDQRAAARYMATLPLEKQRLMQGISEVFNNMPSDAKAKLVASAHNLYRQHEGNLSEILPQSPSESGHINKFVPLAIGLVFALDALNRSQGAKSSLVGNVFTDIGNSVSDLTGGDPNIFGESNYGDMFEYENESSFVNPITGQEHFSTSNPSWWERTWRGAASAAGAFVNPFALVGAGGKAASAAGGQLTTRLASGAGRAQAATGRGIQRLGAGGTRRAGDKAVSELGDMGVSFGAREAEREAREQAVGFLGRQGKKLETAGQSRIDDAVATRAQRMKNLKESVRPSTLAGAGRPKSTFAHRGIQAFAQTDLGQQLPEIAMAGLGALALGSLPNADTSTGGFTPPSQVYGQSATGGAAGGFGQGYGMQDLTNVTGNRMGEDAIFTTTAAPFQGRHGRGTMAQRTVANEGTFGGFGMNKGDNMKIGEQILKEVTERMNDEYLSKAKCPKCGQEHLAKMGCVAKAEKCPHCDGDAPRSKCICGEAKKADKKPAHGMVIVIGSKAGPGPSKDGKRQKLDSEKDKKEE